MSQEVIEITEREIEVIEVVERGPAGPTGPQPNINYEVVSNARTLEAADLIAADTSGGAFTLTLPANPSAGDAVDIFDYSETFDTNPLTIARNGENIESIAEDLICNVEGAYFTMIYTGATRGWQILPRYGTTGGGGESVLTTQGDMVYRGAAINERLPIGSAGQILKVNSGGNAPEWGAAPATGVTSVGVTGSDGIEVDSGSPVTGSGTIALGVNAATLRSHINVADGAEVNVQSNWTEADSGSDAFILNKPTLGTAAAQDADQDLGTTDSPTFTGLTVDNSAIGPATINFSALDGAQGGLTVYDDGGDTALDFVVGGDAVFTASTTGVLFSGPLGFSGVDPASDAATSRTNLGLGDSATADIGTGSGDVAAGDHTHGNLSNDGKIGTTSGLPLKTGTSGVVEAGVFGIGAGEFCEGNDARLSDDRNPTSHASSHAAAGSDPLFDQNLNTTDSPTFGVVTVSEMYAEQFVADGALNNPPTSDVVDFSAQGISFQGTAAATTRTNLGLGNSATLDTGTTAGTVAAGDDSRFGDIPDPSSATPQALGTAAAGTSDDYSRADHVHAAPALNDLSNVSAAAPSDNDVLVYDTATSTWVAEAPAAGGIAGSTGATDGAILRADGTGGSTAQASDIVIDDATTSTQNSVAIVNAHSETNSSVVITPKGTGAFILGLKPDGSTGGNARGQNAVDLVVAPRKNNVSVASGDGAFLGGGSGATRALGINSAVVAGGGDSVGSNQPCIASGNASIVGAGQSNQATATGSCVLGGFSNFATGVRSGVLSGFFNESSATFSGVLSGTTALADRNNLQAHASGSFTSARGTAQRIRAVLRCKTTADSAVEMFGGSDANERLTIPSGKVMAMLVNITGVKSDGSAVAHYVRQYAIKNVGGTTSEVYAPVTIGTDNAASTSITLSANDTNDALKIECTGIASETWRWVASVDAVEVAYGS